MSLNCNNRNWRTLFFLSFGKQGTKMKRHQSWVFRREHMALRNEGEKWMRSIANPLMTVSAIQLFFVALPYFGGNDRNTGRATFVTTKSY